MIRHTPKQGQLGFVHSTAETSKNALKAVVKKRSARMLAAENHLLMAGEAGLLRIELAVQMDLKEKSICSVVSRMIKEGTAVELGDTRPTASGSAAKIVRLARFARKVGE